MSMRKGRSKKFSGQLFRADLVMLLGGMGTGPQGPFPAAMRVTRSNRLGGHQRSFPKRPSLPGRHCCLDSAERRQHWLRVVFSLRDTVTRGWLLPVALAKTLPEMSRFG